MKNLYTFKIVSCLAVVLFLSFSVAAYSDTKWPGESPKVMAGLSLMQYKQAQDSYGDGEGEGVVEGESGFEGEGVVEGEEDLEGESGIEGEGEGVAEGEGEYEGEGAAEGENDECFIGTVSWDFYAGVAALVGLAYGILWLAEDPPSPCMVASAAYGTPMAVEITLLRRFRDVWLLDSTLGTAFVDVYYRGGGVVASYIAQHAWVAQVVRFLLYPVLIFVMLVLFVPAFFYAFIFLLSMVLAGGAIVVWRRHATYGKSDACFKNMMSGEPSVGQSG